MSKASFTITYDGPALQAGVMDVRDLAPALLAVGQIFDAANGLLNGELSKVNVQVTATSRGSFEIGFQLLQSLSSQITHLFAGEPITAALNLSTLVFGGPISLIWLIKRLKGGQPDKVERISDEACRLTFGGETFEVPLKLLRLYQDLTIRTAAQSIVAEPLSRKGITSFEVRAEKKQSIRIEKDEAEYFIKPEIPDEILTDITRRSAFSIISLAFKGDNKWRLHDGNAQISAKITDNEFLKKVDENQVSFSKGDILLCDVRVTQKRTADGLNTEYTVERVIEHKPAARQIPLNLE